MQAMQVRATEMISAAVPMKMSVEGRTVDAPENFGMTWHREMDASGPRPLGTREGKQPQVSNEVKANDGGPEEMKPTHEVAKAEVAPDEDLLNKVDGKLLNAGFKAVVKSDIRAKEELEVGVDAGLHGVPNGSSQVKHALKASSASGSTEGAKSQPDVVPADSVVATIGVGVSVTMVADQISVTQKPAECSPATKADSSSMKGVSSAIKRERCVGPVTKDALSKPVQSAEGSRAEVAAGKDAPDVAMQPGTKIDKGQSAAASSASTYGGHGNVAAVPAAEAGLHLNPAETIGRAVPTMTTAHPANSNAGAEIQLHAATAMAGAEVKSYGAPGTDPAQLEVGVFDGTHGWLRIRAELGAGGAVSASLSTASASAHESLRAALPEMAVYLQSEAVSTKSISVHRIAHCSDVMTAGQGQQGGGKEGRDPRGEELLNYSGATTKNFAEADGAVAASASPSTRSPSYSWTRSTTGLNAGVGGLPGISGLGISSWFGGGSIGSWLNVCA